MSAVKCCTNCRKTQYFVSLGVSKIIVTMGTCLLRCRVWGWGLTPGCHQIFLINGRWTRRQVSAYDYKLGKQRAITTDIWHSSSFFFNSLLSRYIYLFNFNCVLIIFVKTITQIYQRSRYPTANIYLLCIIIIEPFKYEFGTLKIN